MESLKVHSAVYIVSHSMGGMAGVLAQNGSKDIFDALILLGSSTCYEPIFLLIILVDSATQTLMVCHAMQENMRCGLMALLL